MTVYHQILSFSYRHPLNTQFQQKIGPFSVHNAVFITYAKSRGLKQYKGIIKACNSFKENDKAEKRKAVILALLDIVSQRPTAVMVRIVFKGQRKTNLSKC